MNNHNMIARAMVGHAGKVLSTSQIRNIVLSAFPTFNPGSLLPNDHGSGNKSSCWCAGTDSRIFDSAGRGQYRVRSENASPAYPRQFPPQMQQTHAHRPLDVETRPLLRAPRPWEKLDNPKLWCEIESCLDKRLIDWRARILALSQVTAIEARKLGRRWSDADVFEGMLLAILSNSTDWSKVEAIRPQLKPLFSNFDLAAYARMSDTEIEKKFIPWFLEQGAGSMQLRGSLKQLVLAAHKMRSHSAQYGSAEQFLDWLFKRGHSDSKRLAQALGGSGEYKLPGFGIPLAAEFLKNIGYDVAKPDRHVNRAVVCFGLAEFPRWQLRGGYETPALNPDELFVVMEKVEIFSRDVGQIVTFVDNSIWLLCAQSGLHLTNEELLTLGANR